MERSAEGYGRRLIQPYLIFIALKSMLSTFFGQNNLRRDSMGSWMVLIFMILCFIISALEEIKLEYLQLSHDREYAIGYTERLEERLPNYPFRIRDTRHHLI